MSVDMLYLSQEDVIRCGGMAMEQAIQDLERRIVTEWLPTSGYEYDNGPDIEVYLEPDPSQARFEVWIPVVRAQSGNVQ